MRGAPHKGLAWLMRRIRSRMLAATSGLPGRRRDFLVQRQAKARRCQRRTVSGRTISRHRRQPDQNRYNTRAGRSGEGASDAARSFGKPQVGGEARGSPPAGPHGFESWWLPKRKRATKRELIVVATMISRMVGAPVFSDRTEFLVSTGPILKS